ncbi:MAG: Mur ligase domain-containing protein [Bdellovibrionota bacterium]
MRLAQAKVHFIGIGGIGMCGLAELLRNMGGRVSGSDLSENAQTKRLREMGIDVKIGHAPEHVRDAEVVVYSSAVRQENPEFKEARRMKIPLIPRAEALAEIMRLKRGIAVGGSHGKTTTTSLTASIFLAANAQPTIVVGGRLDIIKSTALLGQGEWLIAEADESDGSFSRLSPEIVVVTNIDNDHLDYYGTVAQLKKAFFDFAMRIPFYGLAIVCGDDPAARETFRDYGNK